MRRPVVCVSRDVGASNHDLFFAGVCGTLVLIGWIRTCTCLCVSKNDNFLSRDELVFVITC